MPSQTSQLDWCPGSGHLNAFSHLGSKPLRGLERRRCVLTRALHLESGLRGRSRPSCAGAVREARGEQKRENAAPRQLHQPGSAPTLRSPGDHGSSWGGVVGDVIEGGLVLAG